MATLVDKNQIDETGLPEVNLPVVNAPAENKSGRLQVTVNPTQQEFVQQEPVASDLPLTDSVNIQKAINSGYTTQEIKQYLQNNGLSEDDADLAVVSTVSNNVKKAKEAGYSEDEIYKYLVEKGYDHYSTSSAIKSANVNSKYTNLDYKPEPISEEDKATDLADLYRNIHYEYATMAKQVVGLMDEETAISARRDINRLNAGLAIKLQQEGINAFIDKDTGEVMMTDSNGVTTEVDSSMINSLLNSKGEFIGAVSGGIAGARAGAVAGAALGAAFPPIAPVTTTVGTIVGGLGGSAIGAMGGRAADLYTNSKKLSEDLSTSLYLTQIKQAGIADVTFGVLGAAAVKLTAKGYRGIIKGYKYITHGNPKGAYRALKENLNLSDEQAKDMIDKWEKLNASTAPGSTFEEKAINIVSNTGKGAETAVKSASLINERVATIAKQSIDARAKGLQRAVNSVVDENTGNLIRQDLKAYEDDVKNFYDTIKKQGADAIDGTDFRFDIDKIAIDPVLKHIEAKLSDPRIRERFVGYANRIAYASNDRTFSGLLELRSAVNEFKYSKLVSPKDTEALNTVLNKIDTTIDKAVKQYMPNGKQWTKNFQLAKAEYSKMKVFQENAIYRLINRPGITEEGIQKIISKYSNSKDVDAEIFNAVAKRLSNATRSKAEGAAIKNLVEKNTFGNSSELQAIDFPQLAEDVAKLNLNTLEGRNLATTIEEIAKVYRNDPELSGLTGRSLIEKSSSLATNLLQKAKQSTLLYVWNSIYKYAPLKSSRNIALIHQVEKMLANPLHAKTADEVLKAMPITQQSEMQSLIKQLQIQQAKQGPAPVKATTRMYKQSANGKLVVTNGSLGKGIYLVDKIKNPNSEMNIIGHEVDTSKIFDATGDANIKNLRSDSNLRKQLIDQGYNGVRVEDKVMLFPETMPKEK